MTAPTNGVRFLIARAAIRTTGVAHVVSQRDTGALNPVCGANPIRSKQIDKWPTAASFDGVLCPDCAGIAPNLGALTITDIPTAAISVRDGARRADEGLVDSVRATSVLAPILVTPTDTGYQLVAGARRVDAAARAGLTTIPAIIRTLDPAEQVVASLLENLHRRDLDPIAQAHAYQDAIITLGVSKAELGRRIGVSREQISNTIRLLGLPIEVQERIAAGEVTAEGGRLLLAGINRPKTPKSVSEPQLHDLAHALADYLGVRVRVTGTRIALDVNADDLPRLLNALRAEAAA